ncbi:hypothetical protein Btru_061933 [Bulinus truncatus]|nr:hypothetical protein Btru_061933 [Bulinus truncatus]
MTSVNHLQFLHNIQPVARGLTYLCMKIKALTLKKYYLLTRNYYLLISLMAVPFLVNLFVPPFSCFRLSTEVKKVTMLDVILLNRSTVVFQPIPPNNLSLKFENFYRLVFQDKDNQLNIKVKDIRKISVNRDLSVIHGNDESSDFILIGCKFLTDSTIINNTLLIALYNGQFNYTESLSISRYVIISLG